MRAAWGRTRDGTFSAKKMPKNVRPLLALNDFFEPEKLTADEFKLLKKQGEELLYEAPNKKDERPLGDVHVTALSLCEKGENVLYL